MKQNDRKDGDGGGGREGKSFSKLPISALPAPVGKTKTNQKKSSAGNCNNSQFLNIADDRDIYLPLTSQNLSRYVHGY